MPLSFILGAIGIFADRQRWLALLVTLVAGGIIAVFFAVGP
jgi:hypothetical protein